MVENWNRTYRGGTLSDGNEDGVGIIAEIIQEAVPDVVRLTN